MSVPEQLTIDRRAGASEEVDEAGARRQVDGSAAREADLRRVRAAMEQEAFEVF